MMVVGILVSPVIKVEVLLKQLKLGVLDADKGHMNSDSSEKMLSYEEKYLVAFE